MITILQIDVIYDPESNTPLHRTVKISISKDDTSYLWYVGGLPLVGDLLSILDNRFDELWIAASEKAMPVPVDEVFPVPVFAPDFITATPKVKDDPLEAMREAIAESKRGGQRKSIGLMVLSQIKFTENLIDRIEKLELEINILKRRVK